MGMDVVDVQLDRVTLSAEVMVGDLNHLDVGSCDLEQLGRAAAVAKRLRARLACLDADIARQRHLLADQVGDRPVENLLDPRHQRPAKADRVDDDRAGVFDQFPGIDDATRSGELPAEYADAIATAMKKLDEAQRAELQRRHPDLERTAKKMSLEAFKRHLSQLVQKLLSDAGVNHTERLRRARKVKFWNDFESGMGMITAAYDPETWARIKQAVNQRANQMFRAGRDDRSDTRTRDQLMADALADLILTQPAAGQTAYGPSARPGTDLVVLIDLDTLLNGLHDASVCRTGNDVDLPVDEVRRLACEANIIPVVLDGEGRALDVGRESRLATPEQRAALRAMYPSCAIDGCEVPFDNCEVHHVKPWEAPTRGPTDLDVLAPLCTSGPNHHAQWHREHWTGHIDPSDRALWITYPDGTTERHPLRRHAA
jgi:hypothetical protein